MRYLALAKNGEIVFEVSVRLIVGTFVLSSYATYRVMKKIEKRKPEQNTL